MDYLQLQFNPPPTINVYSSVTVRTAHDVARFGEVRFANLVIGQIGKRVSAVSDLNETLTITFEDGSALEIPFADGTFEGPEAFEFWGKNDKWGVWPG